MSLENKHFEYPNHNRAVCLGAIFDALIKCVIEKIKIGITQIFKIKVHI
jgi:hypothetical protein